MQVLRECLFEDTQLFSVVEGGVARMRQIRRQPEVGSPGPGASPQCSVCAVLCVDCSFCTFSL